MGCKCKARLGNTGAPNCPMLFDITSKLIFVNQYDSQGLPNFIDLTAAPINSAFVVAQLNMQDGSKRWYPTPGELENANTTRAETVFQTFESGGKGSIRKGIRSSSAMIVNADPRLVGRFEEYRCVKGLAVYIVDLDGNLIGSRRDGETSNNLYPILISNGSFDALFNFKTNDAVQNGMITFDWSKIERDGDLYMIRASEMETNLLTIEGLFDVNATLTNISTTGFTVEFKTAYGDPVMGLAITNFFDEPGGTDSSVYNITDGTAQALDTVTEISDGVYDVVFDTAMTLGEEFTFYVNKAKYDFISAYEEVYEI